jgi:hypothetical protein
MVALLVGGAVPSASALGQSAVETPEQVAQAFMQAARDTNWSRVAALLHPAALAQFHSFFAPVLQCQTPDAAEARRTIFGITSNVQAARTPDSLLVVALFRTMASHETGMADILHTAQLRVLGHVTEGSDTVHVVSRLTFALDSFPVGQMEVVSLARDGPRWRVLLKSDFSALAILLRRVCSPRGT